MKLLTVAWLALPQFEGASYLYERFVREHIRKYITDREHLQYNPHKTKTSPNDNKAKKRFVQFVTPNKVSYLFSFHHIQSFKVQTINCLLFFPSQQQEDQEAYWVCKRMVVRSVFSFSPQDLSLLFQSTFLSKFGYLPFIYVLIMCILFSPPPSSAIIISSHIIS